MMLSLFQKLKPDYQSLLINGFDGVRSQRIINNLQFKTDVKELTIGESHALFCFLFPKKQYNIKDLYECFDLTRVVYDYESN